ncbi:MAG: cytochrome c [Planctomycetota bacterium]
MSPFTRGTGSVLLTALGTTVVLLTACHHTSQPGARIDIKIPAPAASADRPTSFDGLHNVVTYADNLVCGSVPEGAEGLETLASMGIRTIISVDGSTPDVANAQRLGMRYVHLPVTYDTVTAARQKELAQAIATLPGPVYMHCHHGKHRSGAALASAVVLAGKLTPEHAMARMQVSGTAPEYTGLWQAVREAKPLSPSELAADPSSFPSITRVRGMVGTMAEIDSVIDLVKQAKHAGWAAPKDHPDLVAGKETKRLHALFAQLTDDADSKALPTDYQTKLAAAIETSKALEDAVKASDAPLADRLLEQLGKSCKECHKSHRDN